MDKIWLIIKREYLIRVKKKSFVVMTILGPILMAALIITPTLLTMQDQQDRVIAISGNQLDFLEPLNDIENTHFSIIPQEEIEALKQDFSNTNYYALLDFENENFIIYSDQQISLSIKRSISSKIEKVIERKKTKKGRNKPKNFRRIHYKN